jgi:hypothetical protein
MTKKQDIPNSTSKKTSNKKEVLASALRENLMRRKNKSNNPNKS